MQGPSYVCNIMTVELMLFSMVLTQFLDNSGMQRYFDLEILTKHQYLTSITNSAAIVAHMIPLMMLMIIDTHAFTYKSIRHL